MARRRGWVLAVVGALAAVPVVGAVSPAGAAVTTTTAFTMAGSPNRYAWVEDASNATMSLQATASSLFVTSTHGDGSNAGGAHLFVEGGGTPLPTSGTHPLGSGEAMSLWLSNGDTGWCVVEGSVTIREMTVDAGGVPTSAAFDWSGDCHGSPSGQVRVASAVPFGGIDVVPTVEFGQVVMGDIAPATSLVVRGHGTQAPTITGAEVLAEAGKEPQYVKVYAGDGCTGKTLGNLQTCAVKLRPAFTEVTSVSGSHSFLVTTSDGATSRTLLHNDGSWTSQRGQFTPLTGRVMDTRKGTGVRAGLVGQGKTVTLKIAGRGIIPSSGTAAAVLNLTVTGSTRPGHVTAYPAGATRPTASSINFPARWTGANLVTVPLGANGSVSFFNNAGSVHLVADLVGIYAKDKVAPLGRVADFHPHDPTRLFDSRKAWGERLGPQEYFGLVADYGAATNDRVEALVVNVTATGATGTSYLSATDIEPEYGPPSTSTLNYTKGLTAANMAVVPRAQPTSTPLRVPTFWIANTGNASTHVVVDIVGYYAQGTQEDPGLRFRSLAPRRVIDTRSDLGLASLGAGSVKRVQAPLSVAGRDTWSLVANLTGVAPSSATYLTTWAAGTRPTASNLNLMKGVTRANSAWPGLDTGNGFRLHNASGSVEAVMDVTGTFEVFPPYPATIAGVPYPDPVAAGAARAVAPEARGPKGSSGPVPDVRTWRR